MVDPNEHLGLVYSAVGRWHKSRPHLSRDDLTSWGFMGLMNAVRYFRAELGNQFSTYATNCINNQILVGLSESSRVPRGLLKANQREGGSRKLLQLDDSFDRAKPMRGPREEAQRAEEISIMRDLVAALPERDRMVLRERFENEKTLFEVSEMLGISGERVRQIEKKALDTLKRWAIRRRLSAA